LSKAIAKKDAEQDSHFFNNSKIFSLMRLALPACFCVWFGSLDKYRTAAVPIGLLTGRYSASPKTMNG
jgi:hypothetical protein